MEKLNSAVNNSVENDSTRIKKEKLLHHVPFITMMIAKVTGTEFERKWKLMHECIVSKKKKMSADQIDKLDATVKKLQREHSERAKIENEPSKKRDELIKLLTSPTTVPKPLDLGKPILTTDDLQSLIDDLSATENETPTPPPIIKMVRPPSPVKVSKPEKKEEIEKRPAIRLPSSWLPSKTTPPSSNKKDKVVGQSILKNFKIPKLKQPSVSPGETKLKLKVFDLFQTSPEITKPIRWTSPKSEDRQQILDKFRIIRSPSVDAQHQIVSVKRPSTEAPMKTEVKRPMIRVKPPKELMAEIERSPTKVEKESLYIEKLRDEWALDILLPSKSVKKETKTVLEKLKKESNVKLELKKTEPEPKKVKIEKNILLTPKEEPAKCKSPIRLTKMEPIESAVVSPIQDESEKDRRRLKELRRLHENIVKDDLPLLSRRSCTLKRVSAGAQNSPNIEDDQEKAPAKRIKSDIEAESPEKKFRFVGGIPTENPVVKLSEVKLENPSNKFRFVGGIPSEPTIEVVKKKKEKRIRCQVFNKISTKKDVKIESVERRILIESILKRPNRKSRPVELVLNQQKSLPFLKRNINALKTSKTTRQSTPIEETIQKLRKDSSLIELDKVFELKPCAISQSSIPDKILKLPSPQKQIAKKSTRRKRTVPLGKFKSKPKKVIPVKVLPVEEDNDDEWEDLDELPSDDDCNSPTPFYNQVFNIGFTLFHGELNFKCLVDGCSYKTLQKYSFVDHLESCHTKNKWNGYCNLCQKIVLKSDEVQSFSMINELMHMNDEHLKKEIEEKLLEVPAVKEVLDVKKISASKKVPAPKIDIEVMKGIDLILHELLPDDELEKEFGNVEKKKPVPVKPAVPQQIVISKNFVGRVIPLASLPANVLASSTKIKLPNGMSFKPTIPVVSKDPILPIEEKINKFFIQKPPVQKVPPSNPDKVSGVPSKLKIQPQPEVKLPKCKKIESLPPIKSMKLEPIHVPKIPEPVKKIETNYLEMLRPWLRKSSTKIPDVTRPMLTPYALSATYKCMGSYCSFYTSDAALFLSHLKFHDKFTAADRVNFMTCCYCVFETPDGTPEEVVEHIKTVHCFDQYQCSYCFYRSCVDFNVFTHQNNYHKMKPRSIIELSDALVRVERDELDLVKSKRAEAVPPIVCVFCRAVFYVFRYFVEHISNHNTLLTTKCTKCQEKTTKVTLYKHLVNCHGFGLYQCVYCRFGTNTFEIISNHIANEHPSKMPLFCERSEYKLKTGVVVESPHPSSIESTCLKHINQNIPSQCIVKLSLNIVKLRNYAAMGLLGDNICIRGFENDPSLSAVKAYVTYNQQPFDQDVPLENSQASEKLNLPESSSLKLNTPKQVEQERLMSRVELMMVMKEKTSSLAELIKKPMKNQIEEKKEADEYRILPRKNQRFKIPSNVGTPLRNITIPSRPKMVIRRLTDDEETPTQNKAGTSGMRPAALQAPEPKPLGLQIQNVFSLSGSATNGGFGHRSFLDKSEDE